MGKQEIKFSISPQKKILFFQNFDVRRLDRDFFPGSQFDDRAVRTPQPTYNSSCFPLIFPINDFCPHFVSSLDIRISSASRKHGAFGLHCFFVLILHIEPFGKSSKKNRRFMNFFNSCILENKVLKIQLHNKYCNR